MIQPSQQIVSKSDSVVPAVELAQVLRLLSKSWRDLMHQSFIVPEGTAVVMEDMLDGV